MAPGRQAPISPRCSRFKLVGVLVVFIGLSMGFSLFWSLYLGEPDARALLLSIGICLVCGGVLFAVGWGSKAPVMKFK